MMKMKQIYLFLSLALLCACSSDEELPAVAQQPCPALELTVSAGGFITDSSASHPFGSRHLHRARLTAR